MMGDHAEIDRLGSLVSRLAVKVGLGEEDGRALQIAASMTGVKRLPIKDITAKTGPLTAEDRERMKEHAAVWAEFAGQVGPLKELGVARLLETYTEHWDGTGHPAGLPGEEVPLAARILSVCYHYNGMTSERAYRKALSHEHAVGELTRMSGTILDPKLVQALFEMLDAGGEETPGADAVSEEEDKEEDKEGDREEEVAGKAGAGDEGAPDSAGSAGRKRAREVSAPEKGAPKEDAPKKGALKKSASKSAAPRKRPAKKKTAPGKGTRKKKR